MSNFKHGFYSKSTSLNPDSILLNNSEIKQMIRGNTGCIKAFLEARGLPDEIPLIHYLISCALPHNEHLLPKTHIEKAWNYYYSAEFQAMEKLIRDTTTPSKQ